MLRFIVLLNTLLVSLCLFSQQWKTHDEFYRQNFGKGDYKAAELNAIDCLKAAEKECNKKDSCYEISLTNLALVYEVLQDQEQSLNYWAEVLKFQIARIETIDPNFGLVATSYQDMFKAIQEKKVALTVYKKCVARLKKVKEVDNTIYYELTAIYSQAFSELYSSGQAITDESLIVTAKEKYGENSSEYLFVIDSLSQAYKSTGKYHKAKETLYESKRIREKTGKDKGLEYARILTSLGYVYFIGQRIDSAIYCYSEGLTLWKKVGKIDNQEYVESFLYYAMSFQFKQDWAKVCDLYEEIAPLVKSAFGEDHYWYSTVLVSLGSFHKVLNNADKAEKYFLEDIRVKKKYGDTTEMNFLADYWGLAGIYDLKGENAKAVFYFKKINDFTLSNIRMMVNSVNISSEKKVAQNLLGFQFSLDWIYSFMSRHIKEFPELGEYVYNDELVKKGLVMRVIKSKMETALSSNDTALIAALDKWLMLRQQIAKLSILPVSERKSNLASLEAEAKKTEDEMYYKIFSLQKDKDLSNSWKDVQKELKPGEAAIEFLNFDYFDYARGRSPDSTYYYALILRPEFKSPKLVYLFCGQVFQSFLYRNRGKNPFDQVRRLYTWPSGAYMDKNRGDSLYNYVWKPLEEELKGVKTVYYCPSGLLHKISFSAITLNDSLTLVNRYNLRQMTSTSMVVNNAGSFELSEEYKALLYGGIFYDLDTSSLGVTAGKYKVHGDFFIRDRSFEVTDSIRGGGSWPYLDGTLKEIEVIDSLFRKGNINTQVLSKTEAVEESFKYSETFHPEIIHIATHGYFLPEAPPPPRDSISPYSTNQMSQINTDDIMQRSGLLFAGANDTWKGKKPGIGLEDGILTAYEVSHLNLSRTKLVVLSACETGLGEVKGSEGVYGLQRAFKLAGADFIIMSLWQVPDEQTMELMKLFYSKWLKGGDIRDAFHEAQNEMSKEYEPYFWAGFVLLE